MFVSTFTNQNRKFVYGCIETYRYGFNGKENDPENGNTQDYGMRIYDTRIAKFLSLDPLTKNYPWYTPYSFAGNKPIRATDLDGAEENLDLNNKPNIAKLLTDGAIKELVVEKIYSYIFSQNYAALRYVNSPSNFQGGPTVDAKGLAKQLIAENVNVFVTWTEVKKDGVSTDKIMIPTSIVISPTGFSEEEAKKQAIDNAKSAGASAAKFAYGLFRDIKGKTDYTDPQSVIEKGIKLITKKEISPILSKTVGFMFSPLEFGRGDTYSDQTANANKHVIEYINKVFGEGIMMLFSEQLPQIDKAKNSLKDNTNLKQPITQ